MMNAHMVWSLVLLGWVVTVPVGTRRLDVRAPTSWVALAWLPVAAAWMLAAAFGARPLGYSDEIVVLTAAHFVHAGFGVSALLALNGLRRALLVHQVGMLTVAAGIALARPLEPVGTLVIATALAGYTAAALRRARRLRGVRRALLMVSAVAWWLPFALAFGWALGRLGVGWVDRTLDEMVQQHGAVNAIGLVLAGLLAHPPARRVGPAHAVSLRKPTPFALSELVRNGEATPLHESPGLLARGGRGWFVDRQVVVTGRGTAAFDGAADAIRGWIKFRQPWTVPAMPPAPIEVGATVGYAARVCGVWWSCCCRIIDVTDETSSSGDRRFGFTYATLVGHPERGEERFLVTLDHRTDDVTFEILAMSRPGRWFTWLGLPIARRAQARFRRGAARAIGHARADIPLAAGERADR